MQVSHRGRIHFASHRGKPVLARIILQFKLAVLMGQSSNVLWTESSKLGIPTPLPTAGIPSHSRTARHCRLDRVFCRPAASPTSCDLERKAHTRAARGLTAMLALVAHATRVHRRTGLAFRII